MDQPYNIIHHCSDFVRNCPNRKRYKISTSWRQGDENLSTRASLVRGEVFRQTGCSITVIKVMVSWPQAALLLVAVHPQMINCVLPTTCSSTWSRGPLILHQYHRHLLACHCIDFSNLSSLVSLCLSKTADQTFWSVGVSEWRVKLTMVVDLL